MTLNSVACRIRSVRVREISQKRVCNFSHFQGSERINFFDYNERVSKDAQGTLRIKDVTQADNAKYVCRAENGYGKFVTASSWLKVRRKSIIVTPPKHALYKVRKKAKNLRAKRATFVSN